MRCHFRVPFTGIVVFAYWERLGPLAAWAECDPGPCWCWEAQLGRVRVMVENVGAGQVA